MKESLCDSCLSQRKFFPECIPDNPDENFTVDEETDFEFIALKCSNYSPMFGRANLCNFCANEFPSCKPDKIEFGNGTGKDNVVKCSGHVWAVDVKNERTEG